VTAVDRLDQSVPRQIPVPPDGGLIPDPEKVNWLGSPLSGEAQLIQHLSRRRRNHQIPASALKPKLRGYVKSWC